LRNRGRSRFLNFICSYLRWCSRSSNSWNFCLFSDQRFWLSLLELLLYSERRGSALEISNRRTWENWFCIVICFYIDCWEWNSIVWKGRFRNISLKTPFFFLQLCNSLLPLFVLFNSLLHFIFWLLRRTKRIIHHDFTLTILMLMFLSWNCKISWSFLRLLNPYSVCLMRRRLKRIVL